MLLQLFYAQYHPPPLPQAFASRIGVMFWVLDSAGAGTKSLPCTSQQLIWIYSDRIVLAHSIVLLSLLPEVAIRQTGASAAGGRAVILLLLREIARP